MSNVVPSRVRWTITDLESLPDEEGKHYEIIDGELFVTRSPHVNHQRLVTRLIRVLDGWSARTEQGEVLAGPGLVFSEYDNVEPDLIWVSRERLEQALDEAGHLRQAPELVVEILSKGRCNEERDRISKLKLYSETGVDEYWIADWRSQTIEVYRRDNESLQKAATLTVEDELTTPLLEGFRASVAEVLKVASI